MYKMCKQEEQTKLKELLAKWEQAQVAADAATNAADTAKLDLVEQVARHLGIEEHDCVIGTHECDKSPVRLCIYNEDDDFMHDECVICHDPNERK